MVDTRIIWGAPAATERYDRHCVSCRGFIGGRNRYYCVPCRDHAIKNLSSGRAQVEFKQVEKDIYIKTIREETGYHYRNL